MDNNNIDLVEFNEPEVNLSEDEDKDLRENDNYKIDDDKIRLYCQMINEYRQKGLNVTPLVEEIFKDNEIYVLNRAMLLNGRYRNLIIQELFEHDIPFKIRENLEDIDRTKNIMCPAETYVIEHLLEVLPNFATTDGNFVSFFVVTMKQAMLKYISEKGRQSIGSTQGDRNHNNQVKKVKNQLIMKGYREEDITPELIAEYTPKEISSNVILILDEILSTEQSVPLDNDLQTGNEKSLEEDFFSNSNSESVSHNSFYAAITKNMNEMDKYIIESVYYYQISLAELMYDKKMIELVEKYGYKDSICNSSVGLKIDEMAMKRFHQNALFHCDKRTAMEYTGQEYEDEIKVIDYNVNNSKKSLGSLLSNII